MSFDGFLPYDRGAAPQNCWRPHQDYQPFEQEFRFTDSQLSKKAWLLLSALGLWARPADAETTFNPAVLIPLS